MALQWNNEHVYASQRFPVYGQRGMVATSSSLAAQAGLDILKKGGNAVDAALQRLLVSPCVNLPPTESVAMPAIVAFGGKLLG